jgi:cytochrome c peroxidase
MRREWFALAGALALVSCRVKQVVPAGAGAETREARVMALDPLAAVGELIFFDESLSDPPGQSCASCHSPETGFTGPTSAVNAGGAVYPGAADAPGQPRVGNRKPSSAAYATPSPVLRYDAEEDLLVGGLFWDGRATGWALGSPAAEQAQRPFLNPVEQNLSSARDVVGRICSGAYEGQFTAVFPEACSAESDAEVRAAYDQVGRAVAAFEASPAVNRYGSRYDRYLRGEAKLTAQERDGLALFEGKAKCAECHPAEPGEHGEPPDFTDHTFDNLGLPRNPRNPFYAAPASINPDGPGYVDPGLGGFLASSGGELAAMAAGNLGKHRVPTLRNVDKRPYPGFVKAYGHNGVFKTLEQVVHFYNTRDVLPRCEAVEEPAFGVNCWPAPEVRANLNTEELGDLRLTASEVNALVAFLRTLSDE